VTTLERCTHPHAWPAIECDEGIRLTRARRVPVCMCGHPRAVHEYARAGRTDCGMCDCRSYETARRNPSCRCGHGQRAHEHGYSGVDESCSACDCPEYSNPYALRWILLAVVISGTVGEALVWAFVRFFLR
jgi:hypothetical protein